MKKKYTIIDDLAQIEVTNEPHNGNHIKIFNSTSTNGLPKDGYYKKCILIIDIYVEEEDEEGVLNNGL